MRKTLTLVAAFALFATTQAFAIIGFGAHYVMNTGSLKSDKGSAYTFPNGQSIDVSQQSADMLQGLGFKLWIDFLPFVDIEGTFNVTATRYKTFLAIPGYEPISLEFEPEAPYSMVFDKATPIFGIANGDLSITYPFEIPVIPIRPYIGAGISYFASIPIVNASFSKKMLSDSPEVIDLLEEAGAAHAQGDADAVNEAATKLGEILSEKLKEESYTTGIGGHIIAGIRIKPPIIPLAVYANGKYYFGGSTSSQFSQGFVLEVGGGLAL